MNDMQTVFNTGKQILKNGGVEDYSFDTACLLEEFCKITRTDLLIGQKSATDEQCLAFFKACEKRADEYPLQYILGHWGFYGLDFLVDDNVLIPRADTETLIDYITDRYDGAPNILDMCCGSGCIGLTLKKLLPNATLTLCDISDGALRITRKNAKRLGVDVQIKKADVTKGYKRYFKRGAFDIIVSNPPYIKNGTPLAKELSFEPDIALFGGDDGMDFYRALILCWKDALKCGGELVLESGHDTWQDIVTLFKECEWRDIVTKKDIGGIVRTVAAKI